MEQQQIQQILGELRFLAGLSDSDQQKIAAIAQLREFKAGTELFSEGNAASDMYLLRNGRVELCLNVPARGCLPVLTLEAGDLVGWSAALGQNEMTATAVAVVDTETIALGAAEMRRLCEDDHDIGYEIMRRVALALSRRLVATRLQILDLFEGSTTQAPIAGTNS